MVIENGPWKVQQKIEAKEPTTRIEFLGKRRMKEMHCAPKGIETLEFKLTNLQEKIRRTSVRGGKRKEKDAWEAFGVHQSQKKHLYYFQENEPTIEVAISLRNLQNVSF